MINSTLTKQEIDVGLVYQQLCHTQKDLLNRYKDAPFCYLLISSHNISSSSNIFQNLLLSDVGCNLATLEAKQSIALSTLELAKVKLDIAHSFYKLAKVKCEQWKSSDMINPYDNNVAKARDGIERAQIRIARCQEKVNSTTKKLNEFITKLEKTAEQPHEQVIFYYDQDDRLVIRNESK